MSTPRGYGPQRETGDLLFSFLEGLARFVFWTGVLGAITSTGFLVYYMATFGSANELSIQRQTEMVGLFRQVLLPAVFAASAAAAFLFWTEEVLGILLLIAAALLYAAPLWGPAAFSDGQLTQGSALAAQALQSGGTVLGGVAILVLAVDIVQRVRTRIQQGARSDSLRYGKGVKEERDVKNVLMGKCWQLPYCRKFVREQCPIYHSQRTCWKERVGCMCEESVISSALSGKAIPKDAIAAAQYIPRNSKLTPAQKAERCRQCIIYNEHQRHKYKIAVPTMVVAMIGAYLAFKPALLGLLQGAFAKADQFLSIAALSPEAQRQAKIMGEVGWIQEVVLIALMFVVLAYLLKLIEFLVFQLKI